MVQAQLAGRGDTAAREGALGQVVAVLAQADLARFHDLEADALAVLEVGFHELAEAGEVGRIGPEVRELGVGLGAAVEVLLVCVWGLAARTLGGDEDKFCLPSRP